MTETDKTDADQAAAPEAVPETSATRLAADDGQVTVAVGSIALIGAVGVIMLIASLGGVAVDRARARTAADAAALAGAADGEPAARDVAQRNAGVLEVYRVVDGQTEVTVRVGRARATSRAVRTVGGPAPPPRVSCCAPLIPYTRSNVLVRASAHRPRG